MTGHFKSETLALLKRQHEDMIYPTVRVRTQKAGGSGLIIYSEPLPNQELEYTGQEVEYETYVMTCYHVVEDAITYVKKKHPFADRKIEVEVRDLVQVEIFQYEKMSKIVGATQYQAEIVAWDKQFDLALLKLQTSKKMDYVAKLYPKGKSDLIKIGMGSFSCGCSLGHEPILNKGRIMGKHDMIENELYWLSTANTIFGNSGGSDFLVETHEYIGITARISGYQLGFSVDIITWMGFIIPIETIYKFWDDQIFMFLYDKKYNSKQCGELRKKKREEEEKKLLLPPESMKIRGIEKEVQQEDKGDSPSPAEPEEPEKQAPED